MRPQKILLILIECSRDMLKPFTGSGYGTIVSKAKAVDFIINSQIRDLYKSIKNQRDENTYIAMIGYSSSGWIDLLDWYTNGRDEPFVNVRQLNFVKDFKDWAAGGIGFSYPSWFDIDPHKQGLEQSWMYRVLEILDQWRVRYPHSASPCVLNIMSKNNYLNLDAANIANYSSKFKDQLSSGDIRCYNVHLHNYGDPISFPSIDPGLESQVHRGLFELSSPLTSSMSEYLSKFDTFSFNPYSRGLVLESNYTSMLALINSIFSTITSDNLRGELSLDTFNQNTRRGPLYEKIDRIAQDSNGYLKKTAIEILSRLNTGDFNRSLLVSMLESVFPIEPSIADTEVIALLNELLGDLHVLEFNYDLAISHYESSLKVLPFDNELNHKLQMAKALDEKRYRTKAYKSPELVRTIAEYYKYDGDVFSKYLRGSIYDSLRHDR